MSRSRMLRWLVPVVLVGCADVADPTLGSEDPSIPPPQLLITDAVHGGGNEHFFWLPPMVGDPGGFNGAFDATLALAVRICDLADCANLVIAEFTTTTGPGSETVRVVPESEHYIVNWHTDQFEVAPGPTYRIQVLVAGTELAVADVQLAATGKDAKNLTTGDIIGLKDGRTLPIKFRLEEGAVFAIGGEGGSFTALGGSVVLGIPAGALSEPVGITVEPSTDFPANQGLIPGSVFEFRPDGTVFTSPATLTLSYDDTNLGGIPESSLTILTEEAGVWVEVVQSVVDETANTITALIDGFSKKGVGGKVTSVDVSPASATLEPAETIQLAAVPMNGAGQPVARNVAWTSPDPSVATVDNTGLVTAVDAGTVAIEARSGSVVGTSDITVQPPDPCLVVSFADPLLEQAMRDKLGIPTAPITGGDAQALSGSLMISGLGITSLIGLECFTGITALDAANNQIADLSPIAGLTGLTSLFLRTNQITDLTPLSGLTGLTSIAVDDNPITDLSGLETLAGVTYLDLYNTGGITDVTPLAGMTSLKTLKINNGAIGTAAALASLTQMEDLNLFNAGLTDLSFMATMTGLVSASLDMNPFTDLSPLSGLNSLRHLRAEINQLTDLSPISGLTGLLTLNLNNGPGITDIAPIAALTSLTSLSLRGGAIGASASVLPNFTQLTYLRLMKAGISDVSFVTSMPNLGTLVLRENPITDPTPILGLGSLSFLDLLATPITCDDAFYGQVSNTVSVVCNQAPTANIVAPADNTQADEFDAVMFQGTGTDPENGALTGSSLVWTSDLDGQFGTGTSVTTTTLTPGSHHIVLEVSDNFGGTGSSSISFVMRNRAPTADITSPADNSSFDQGDPITFTGAAADGPDPLSASAVTWSSDIDGPLGSGLSITTSSLSPGAHKIRFEADDSEGGVTVTEINITINTTGPLSFSLISAGNQHSCAMTTAGAGYCWGLNDNGQLGTGTNTNSDVPVAVSGGLIFQSVSAGGGSTTATDHSCGVTTAGVAYCWGDNTYGQLGDGTNTSSSIPVAVAGSLTFQTVSVSQLQSCGVTVGGAAYCWGIGGLGSLGNGMNMDSSVPVAVSGGLAFQSVTVGGAFNCGVTTAGTAYCWGNNYLGRLGNGGSTNTNVPVAVAGGLVFQSLNAGDVSSCGITTAGAAYCWGDNTDGQLGNGTNTSSSVPVAVSGGLTFQTVSTEGFVRPHSCGVTAAGAAYCWGNNQYGVFGDGTNTSSSVPVAATGGLTFQSVSAGQYHVCGVTTAGAGYCWGLGSFGRLGHTPATASNVPLPVSAP